MTTLGKYELHEELGRGGFGTVYRATDTSLEREVAIKILHPLLTADPDFMDKFRKEARIVAGLKSPYIVTVHELAEEDGRIFIVMEYMEGGSLEQKLKKQGAFSFDSLKKILRQVGEGLEVAHEKGLVHRDIKPANILFDSKGNAVISDFGLAKAIQNSSISAASSVGSVGTPAYRAPELWQDQTPTQATDIYSLGCVLYEMITGDVLFDATTPEGVITQHLVTGPRIPEVLPDGIPSGMEEILRKMLAKQPNERFASTGEVLKAMDGLDKLGKTAATEPSKPQPKLEAEPAPVIPPALPKENEPPPSQPTGSNPQNSVWKVIGVIAVFSLLVLVTTRIKQPIRNDPEKTVVTSVPTASIDPCSTRWGCAIIPSGETIKIGMSQPMAGPYADFGTDAMLGGLIAISDFGDLEGFSFELIVEDDEGSAEGSVAVANKLISDPTFVAMAGPLFSGSTLSAMPIYEEAGIPMMSFSAANEQLTANNSPVFNRLPFTDSMQGKAAAQFMYDNLKYDKIAIIHNEEDYGTNLARAVEEEFEALGGIVTYSGTVAYGQTDFYQSLKPLENMEIDALYYGGYDTEGALIAAQMESAGLADVTFFGCDGTYGSYFIETAGESAEGSIHAIMRTPPDTEKARNFDRYYEDMAGVSPLSLSPFSYMSYDSVYLLLQSIANTAHTSPDGSLIIPRAALVEAVRNTNGYVGLSGTYTCNEIGECNTEGPRFDMVVNSRLVEIKPNQ